MILHHKVDGFLDDIAILRTYMGKVDIGWQMAWSSGDRLGPMETAVSNGLTVNSKYMEIYDTDIVNPQYETLLKGLAEK